MTVDEHVTRLRSLASLATPMAVRVAATLRIADHIAGGVRTTAELADAVAADPATLDRVLRHLCDVEVLCQDGAGGYALTEKGELLTDDHPLGTRARLDIEGGEGNADLTLVHLLHTVRTGEPAFVRQYGQSFWAHLSAHPALADSFHRRMGMAVRRDAADIATAYDWGSLDHVVDVGGGNGTLLIALLDRYPRLRGTIVDLPGAEQPARAALSAAGLLHRAEFVVGSFFDALPANASAYVLSAIIHNWNDDDATAILRRCAEVAGKVFVIERLGPDGVSPDTEVDLRMVAYFGGRERSVDEICALAGGAGLEVVAVHGAGSLAVVELGRRE